MISRLNMELWFISREILIFQLLVLSGFKIVVETIKVKIWKAGIIRTFGRRRKT